MRRAALLLWLYFVWTNPPDLDLHEVRFYVWPAGTTDTMKFSYFGRCELEQDENCPAVIHPGLPDSTWIALPCRSTLVRYFAYSTNVDTTGRNECGPSNLISFRTRGGLDTAH